MAGGGPPKAGRQRPAERYRLKYSRLRRAARALVFENGALCDEVARLEAKCLRARDERRFLLTRLLQLRAAAGPEDAAGEPAARRPRRGGKDGARSSGARDGARPTGARDAARSTGPTRDESRPTGPTRDESRPAGPREESRPTGPRPVGSRDAARPTGSRDGPREGAADGPRPNGLRDACRPPAPRDGPRDEARDGPGDDCRPNGPRGGAKPDAPPAAVLRAPEESPDPAGPPAAILRPPPRRRGGAPALPLALGPLTVHSLGVSGVGPGAGLPLGFRSTRLFASARRPARRCLYTCRVVAGPRCEIEAEDEPGRVLAGATPDVCHAQLLRALGRPRAAAPGAGDEFFGLAHPAVRRLLRGEAGGFLHPEEEEEEEEEEEDDDDDEEDDDEEEEEDGPAPAFAYADIFLGSPAGSDE